MVDKFLSSQFFPVIDDNDTIDDDDDDDNNNYALTVDMNFLSSFDNNKNSIKKFIIIMNMPHLDYGDCIKLNKKIQYRLRSCCYSILWDDHNLNDKQLKYLCYSMCNYYYRRFSLTVTPILLEYALNYNRDACAKLEFYFYYKIVDDDNKCIEKLIKYFNDDNLKIHNNLKFSII